MGVVKVATSVTDTEEDSVGSQGVLEPAREGLWEVDPVDVVEVQSVEDTLLQGLGLMVEDKEGK